MSKKRNDEIYEQRIIDALKRLPKVIYDKKHNLNIHIEDDQCRSNETRFEHIAKKYHELKVRDIEAIPKGINCYLKYSVSLELKETYYYYIRRKGEDKGFIQVAVKLYEGETTEAYVKTIFITHRIKRISFIKKFDIMSLPKVENQCATTTHLVKGGYGVPGC